jgi:tRNA pseudouridine38-40 synthase
MKKRNIKLTIEYDGSLFNGWQIQIAGTRTVQGELKKSLEKICKEKINVLGSGRTDSGVHALGQVAHFQTTTDKNCSILHRALNANLPDDISVVKVEEVPSKFHAQYSAKSKTYRYLILNRKTRSALDIKRVLFYPHKIDVKLMKEEAKVLVGRHDFKAFQAADVEREDRSTIRTITKLEIKKRKDVIAIEVSSNGFLYKMVRNIVGTLLSVAAGQLPKGSTKNILKSKDRTQAPAPARASGLYLLEVKY